MSKPIDDLGRSVPMPGANAPVRLRRLHLDRRTLASLSVVRFPAGWVRPVTGHYLVGEEFVVLDGRLELNGALHVRGDWAWLPPRATRSHTATPDGATALAWFSGAPEWRDGVCAQTPDASAILGPRRPGATGPLRPADPQLGSSAVLTDPHALPTDRLWDALPLRGWGDWREGDAAAAPLLHLPGTPVPAVPLPAMVRFWP